MRAQTVLATLLVLGVCDCREHVVEQIAESHVDANVPAPTDFDRLMRRDLESYFGTMVDKPVVVEYELLRDGPTQSGVAYPKFYVWVRARTGEGGLSQGAVRLAAVERKEFQVTNYVPEADIRAHPDGIYQVFPGPVCEKIKNRLGI
jgi:hypothetical protein